MKKLQTVLDALEGMAQEPVAYVVALKGRPISMTVPVNRIDELAAMHNAPLYAAPVAVQAVPAWLPIESAPKDGTLVVLYSPNGPDDWPDSFQVTFDYFCEDYENWFHHSEAHEHYMAVGGSNACGPDVVCTGPSEKAPYTHWMPLPAAPVAKVEM